MAGSPVVGCPWPVPPRTTIRAGWRAFSAPIVAEREYLYVVERGPVPAPPEGETPMNAVRLRGLTLLDLERGRLDDAGTMAQAKQLMRLLINHSLNGQELATRAMVRDLQRLEDSL